jgi:hypothetical protein
MCGPRWQQRERAEAWSREESELSKHTRQPGGSLCRCSTALHTRQHSACAFHLDLRRILLESSPSRCRCHVAAVCTFCFRWLVVTRNSTTSGARGWPVLHRLDKASISTAADAPRFIRPRLPTRKTNHAALYSQNNAKQSTREITRSCAARAESRYQKRK